jgi:hypothetical protein
MWVSGLTCLGLFVLLLFLTIWRPRWTRLLNWEESLWKRAGIGAGLLSRLRRMEDSRLMVPAVVALLLIHLGLFAVSAGAHHYFAPKLKAKAAHTTPREQPRPRNK